MTYVDLPHVSTQSTNHMEGSRNKQKLVERKAFYRGGLRRGDIRLQENDA